MGGPQRNFRDHLFIHIGDNNQVRSAISHGSRVVIRDEPRNCKPHHPANHAAIRRSSPPSLIQTLPGCQMGALEAKDRRHACPGANQRWLLVLSRKGPDGAESRKWTLATAFIMLTESAPKHVAENHLQHRGSACRHNQIQSPSLLPSLLQVGSGVSHS